MHLAPLRWQPISPQGLPSTCTGPTSYWLVIALMLGVLLVSALLTRPFHAMPQIIPLKGID